jgi:hypothetical protein
MNRFIRPRWRLPLAVAAGTAVVGVASAVGPDSSRGSAIVLVIGFGVTAAVNARVNYVRAGKDTDEGAIRGSRADERQKQVSGRAWALAGMTGLAGAAAGFAITAAIAGWGAALPFGIMVILTAAGLLAGVAVAVRPWSSREFPVAAVIVYGAAAAVAAAAGREVRAGDHGGRDAGFGSRADERQNQISRRAWALAGMTVSASAYAGYVATLAVGGEGRAWPFQAIGVLAALCYFRGLTRYGADGPGLDADAEDGPAPLPGPPQPDLTPFGFGHYRPGPSRRQSEYSPR